MEQDATKLIQQRIAELPPDVRNAVGAADLTQKIQAVGTKHNLHIDQMGELEDETLLAMLGFSPLESLGRRLAAALRLDPQAGEQLAQDISTGVFGPVRESMKKFVEERAKTAAVVKPEVSSQAQNQSRPIEVGPKEQAEKPPPTQPVKPPASPDMHKADPSRLGLAEADVMLTEKTVDLAPTMPKAPQDTVPKPPLPSEAPAKDEPNPIYKVDPYHEPV